MPRAQCEPSAQKYRYMKTILWDNDGVLVDTERLYFECTRDMMRLVGVELTRERYLELALVQGVGTFSLVEDRGVSEARIQELRAGRDRRYVEKLRTEPVAIDGVASALERLGERYSMGVVTTSRREYFDVVHARTGWAKFFDFVVAFGDYERAKPAPDPYLAALERNGLRAEECVAVEDSQRGLKAAKAAGLTCYAIPNVMTRGADFSAADGVFSSIGELAEVLLNG